MVNMEPSALAPTVNAPMLAESMAPLLADPPEVRARREALRRPFTEPFSLRASSSRAR